jgi:DNA-binding MarR family transcriptional regulator
VAGSGKGAGVGLINRRGAEEAGTIDQHIVKLLYYFVNLIDHIMGMGENLCMTKVRRTLAEAQEQSFGQILIACAHLLDRRGQARLNAALGEELARPSVMRLIPYLTPEGIRTTELARQVDVSKQAVSQTLAILEERGLVEYTPDSSDGRARLVRMTGEGARMAGIGLSVLAEIQREIEARVGCDVIATTFLGLQEIHRAFVEDGSSS